MPLPPYFLKVILTSRMGCIVAMMMYMGGVLQVLFESFSKDPGGSPYVFIITGNITALEPIYGPTFADLGVFVLGETSRFLIVLPPLKWVQFFCSPSDLMMSTVVDESLSSTTNVLFQRRIYLLPKKGYIRGIYIPMLPT